LVRIYNINGDFMKKLVIAVDFDVPGRWSWSGVGYRGQFAGAKKLVLNVGLSHPVIFEPEEKYGD